MTIGAILKTNECKKTILKLKFSRRKYCCVYRDTYLKVTHEYTEQLTEKKNRTLQNKSREMLCAEQNVTLY